MRWIKASERSPDYNPVRLVHLRFSTDKTGFKLTGYYKDGQWYRQYGEEKILDWAPNLEWLDESIPASIEQEANRLYPYPQETYVSPDGVTKMYSNDNKCKAEGYITAARQYMDTIDKLRAENEKMRKALEWADEEINALYQKDGTWGSEILGEIRQALKTTTHG